MTEHHPPHRVCWITPAELATFATSDGDVGFYNTMYYSSLLKVKGIRSAVADGETLPCPCGRTITSPAQIRGYLRCVWERQSEDGRKLISGQTYVICTGVSKTPVGLMNDCAAACWASRSGRVGNWTRPWPQAITAADYIAETQIAPRLAALILTI
jgi:hypothetical protein